MTNSLCIPASLLSAASEFRLLAEPSMMTGRNLAGENCMCYLREGEPHLGYSVELLSCDLVFLS